MDSKYYKKYLKYKNKYFELKGGKVSTTLNHYQDIMIDGGMYTGMGFENGLTILREGYGTMRYLDSVTQKIIYIYEGEWHNDKYNIGTLSKIKSNGMIRESYKGTWGDHGLEGLGKYISSTMTYEGTFYDHKKEGYGIMTTYIRGIIDTIYKGMFHNNMKHGEGRLYIVDEDTGKEDIIDMGTWENDVKVD
jgi:hypothetical protein